mmetsp:Transcript_121160/g.354080  ORF Transcript_121160/g.354080 Transcript_121160/m.354080 type:complete len:210 (+) Transcript_121160:616-1245(+)
MSKVPRSSWRQEHMSCCTKTEWRFSVEPLNRMQASKNSGKDAAPSPLRSMIVWIMSWGMCMFIPKASMISRIQGSFSSSRSSSFVSLPFASKSANSKTVRIVFRSCSMAAEKEARRISCSQDSFKTCSTMMPTMTFTSAAFPNVMKTIKYTAHSLLWPMAAKATEGQSSRLTAWKWEYRALPREPKCTLTSGSLAAWGPRSSTVKIEPM